MSLVVISGVLMFRRILRGLLVVAAIFAFTTAGFFAGIVFAEWDPLCSSPKPVRVLYDLDAEGVLIKRGAVVPLKTCAYLERFTLGFGAVPDLAMSRGVEGDWYETLDVEDESSIRFSGGIIGFLDATEAEVAIQQPRDNRPMQPTANASTD